MKYIGNNTPIADNLRIEPLYSGENMLVAMYKIVDEKGTIWFIGTRSECEQQLNNKKTILKPY